MSEVKSTRRAFLGVGGLVLAAGAVDPNSLWAEDATKAGQGDVLRVGLVTDLHYADKPASGTRHYRETPQKLEEAARQFEKSQLDLLVELGDLVDAADSVQTEETYLKTINRQLASICKDRHYVLGNHCVDTLRKEEFLAVVEQKKSYYSFDRGQYHFIVLDACFRSDGQPYGRKNSTWTDTNIPSEEMEWLEQDLKANQKKTVVLAHQRLDVSNSHGVKNNAEVRKLLEASGQVLVVFQGHSHQNDLKQIAGIHYCTLVAMVEGSGSASSGYAVVSFDSDATIRIDGFRKQADYAWKV